MELKIYFLGGALEVGASCILVRINNKNILMDCGIRQGGSKDSLPDFRLIQENGGIDAVIISHAHMDHIGSLPLLLKEYPLAKVYANNMTKELMRVLLYDSIKIMNSREVEIPLYREIDVEDLLNRTYTYNFEVPFTILEDIRVIFYMAGHIPGASCIYITSQDGSVFYSGDFSIFPQVIVEGAKIPKLRPDVAILESTYGDKLHANRKLEEEKLVEIVQERLKSGGKILIPSFALGRAQEVLLILKKAKNIKALENVNIYIDGMIKDINIAIKRNPLYLKNSLCKKILKGNEPFYDDNIIPVTNAKMREEILKSKEPCVIISSSGMITGGPSQYYAEKLLQLEESTVIISGYQDEESPGRRILELLEGDKEERRIEINNKLIPVRATLEKVSLSAHGDKSEIKALNERLSPKNLFLVHGNSEVISSLAKEISATSIGRVYAPKVGDSYSINIENPREQIFKNFKYRLNYVKDVKIEDLKNLRNFIVEKYGFRNFTANELLMIWHGEKEVSHDYIKQFELMLMESIYFTNDNRRLFMFEPSTDSDIEANEKKEELNQTEVHNLLKETFDKHGVKKIGLQVENKKVILYFDFPKIISSGVLEIIKTIENNIKWEIEINKQTNLTAMNKLIMEMLPEGIVGKISNYIAEEKVEIKLLKDIDIKDIKNQFKAKTGFNLTVKGESTEEITITKEVKLDQNELINIIDTEFENERFRPYKKSVIKIGYMKLAFISPVAGKMYEDKIQGLILRSGWNIEVADIYNQNEIINISEIICNELNIKLKKRPSFINGDIKLNIDNIIENEILHEFEKQLYCKTLVKLMK